jgi:Mg-chelatase subunit ChlD
LTNIGGGIAVGSNSIETDRQARPFAEKAIVVMTDGRHNTGTNPLTAANAAAALGHSIHAVTFSAGADQTRMQQVANAANGSFIHADGAADLGNAFRDIARTLFVKLID